MCQTANDNIDDMDEISSTSHKKTGKLIEPRKIRKPLMEKKRRARINQSLDELKRIVVDAEKLAGQDISSRVNKLEKADILEMTVRYLKRKTITPPPAPRSDVYLAGYRQCVEQVQDLLAEQWTDERRHRSGQRMIQHLEACVQRLNVSQQHPLNGFFRDESNNRAVNDTSVASSSPSFSSSSEDDDEEFVAVDNASTARPSPNRTTQLEDIPPKSMWRPW